MLHPRVGESLNLLILLICLGQRIGNSCKRQGSNLDFQGWFDSIAKMNNPPEESELMLFSVNKRQIGIEVE